jgi:4-carboxymuconolactone decarboxylase
MSDREGEGAALDAARAMRRRILGDAYVDAQADGGLSDAMQQFQDHIVANAWGAWAREGPLSTRDRSLLVLAITAALGRMEEFRLHAGARTRAGVTDDEVDELLFMVAAYCGAPAGVSAKRAIGEVRAAEGATG